MQIRQLHKLDEVSLNHMTLCPKDREIAWNELPQESSDTSFKRSRNFTERSDLKIA